MLWALLGLVGLLVGGFGTLIGVAGGFILMPVLLFLYPADPPATITSITLAVTFFNALSGSIAYGRLRRTDYRSGLLFSLASVPGAIIGASITGILTRRVFEYLFGAALLLAASYLIVRPERRNNSVTAGGNSCHEITDGRGNVFSYSFSRTRGIAIAFAVGLVSGLLGIGGGIVHVPALTQLLCFPTHIATATSLFVVTTTTFAAVITHIVTGAFSEGVRRAVVLSAGAVIGAQFGARLSQRVSGVVIVRVLAAALALVSLRLLIMP